ncbi:MAG: extracellular solute-binding protein [Anaerolineae bacterium]|nr:extracellular solute-binding protein [Anaerolineae bacterium]
MIRILFLAITLLLIIPTPATPGAQTLTLYLATGAPERFASAAAHYMEMNPDITVVILPVPGDATDQLARYREGLREHTPKIDLYDIEVTWPPLLASYLVDLKPYVEAEAVNAQFPAIIDAMTLDGRLLALPYHIDVGALYYRPDLLEAYGYDAPPATWDELTETARVIQDGERADKPYFWGYLWQGERYETLTCGALEWGVGPLPGVDNRAANAALARAAGWVGAISPPAVTAFTEDDTSAAWLGGQVAFLRDWTYLARATADFPMAVTPLPEGGCLRGWGLAVAQDSKNVEAAAALAVYLTDADAQKERAFELPANPTYPALYRDPELLDAFPMLRRLEAVFADAGIIARPAAEAGLAYDRASGAYFTAVHRVLTGERDAGSALSELEPALSEIWPAAGEN